MTFKIEPFDYEDASYEAIAAIEMAMFPEYPSDPEDYKRGDRRWNSEHYKNRYVIREPETGKIIAFGSANHDPGSFHPQKLEINYGAYAEHDGGQMRSQWFAFLRDSIAHLNPTTLETWTRSDKLERIAFLEQCQFRLATREYASQLDLNSFDPAPFAPTVVRAGANGIEIVDLTEFRQRYPETFHRTIYDSVNEIHQDVPWHDTFTPRPYEQFVERFEDNPFRVEECFLIALDGDEMVGVTMLFKSKKASTLFTGLTGVKRTHRRKGIAVALKIKALTTAQAMFCTDENHVPVTTENEENNPMYTINERLGFKRMPDWMCFRKELNTGEDNADV